MDSRPDRTAIFPLTVVFLFSSTGLQLFVRRKDKLPVTFVAWLRERKGRAA